MIPVLFFYTIGFIGFIFSLWEDGKDEGVEGLDMFLWPGLSLFVNIIGYYLSYTDSDFTYSAYFPLALMILSAILLIYRLWTSMSQTADEFSIGDDEEHNSNYIE